VHTDIPNALTLFFSQFNHPTTPPNLLDWLSELLKQCISYPFSF